MYGVVKHDEKEKPPPPSPSAIASSASIVASILITSYSIKSNH